MTATTIPSGLASHRERMMAKTGLRGDAYGVAPNESHKAGGGYHCGVKDCQNIGKFHPPVTSHIGSSTEDYSVRQLRDRGVGGNAASAEDIGGNWPRGGKAAWLRFNNVLVGLLRAGDRSLRAVREVNFTPNGTARKRWDALHPEDGIINSTDTAETHTHIGFWRDTDGTPARAEAFARIEQIAEAAIENRLVAATDTEEEEEMGASFGPIEINASGETSLTLPPVEAGIADPRQAWVNFCNDTNGAEYGLRVWYTTGNGAYTALPGWTNGEKVLKSGVRESVQLPKGTCGLTVSRTASMAYAGHLTLAIERGPVQKS